ncbi:hypothetical protein [Dictyobacter kobayashii]|uniref:NACHT domain-containing protein n=1 Tax=Dictyobacter kobayashii TaxID=2014872 RepID=A0A402AS50_9CHLR|nr:hypothetical protein [Dictyobacter kobayashii]GCE21927.1 hypothetical protein KDK_57270 [Dictyobacter kobayashii]
MHWCQQLFKRRELAIVYFPVSIRFRTNLAGITFPALAALLASLHGEQIPKDPNLAEEFWRTLLSDYLMRPLPDGRRLLLVLDGIDEAADWTAGSPLFPRTPPTGLRIVLSARSLANDQGADSWLQRLGWEQPGQASTLELLPLDRSGISNVLHQIGFPLDLLSARFDIISELYRLSEGDPLLIRLYVDDLWKRGEAVVQFTQKDLRAIHPGLEGYFERWWKDQRQLWKYESPQREGAIQLVLNILACALGPLSKKDIMSLLPGDMQFQEDELEQYLVPLARFVTGDGIHQGYVFSHPRLGNYFYEERLNETEREEIEQRFLKWGAQTLTALNEASLQPEQASVYIVQYYGAHLERAQASTDTLLTLVSNGWRRAWEKLDRAQAGFLGDVERAWQAIEQLDREMINGGELASYQGEEILCLLCQVSVNSMTNSISSRLMLEAVKTGIWTPAQGLACIRLISDLTARALELVALAPYVQEPVKTEILHEALDTISTLRDEYTRFDAIIAMAPGLSEELLRHILETIPAIEDEADRAGILVELAPSLAPYPLLLEKVIVLVQEIEEEEYRALAYEGLAAYSSTEQRLHILELACQIEEERYRIPVLIALIPYVPESSLQEIFQQSEHVLDGLSRMRLLTELVVHLPERWKAEALQASWRLEQDIEDRDYRIEALIKLAPYLSRDQYSQALHEMKFLWDDRVKARALMAIAPYVPEESLLELLQIVLAMKSDEECNAVLLLLLSRLTIEHLEPVLEHAQSIWDEGCRANLLAALGPYLPEKLFPRLLELLLTIHDPGYRVWLLAELEDLLQGKSLDKQYSLTVVFQAMAGREERLQTLLAIAPRLSDRAIERLFSFMLPEIFDFAWKVHTEEMRAHILTKLGMRLPNERLARALDMVQSFQNEAYRVQVLIELAPRLYGDLLSKALDIVRGMKERDKRAQVLEVLVSSLPKERRGERVYELLHVLQLIKDEAERTHIICVCLSLTTTTLPMEQEQLLVGIVPTLSEKESQAEMLRALAPHLRPASFPPVFTIVESLDDGEEQTRVLEALAPYVSEEVFIPFFRLVLTFQQSRWRSSILAKTVPHLSESIINKLMEMALLMPNEELREEIIEALASYMPEVYVLQVLEIALAFTNRGRQLTILKALAPRIPGNYFPSLWDTIEGQWWLLQALAPHLSEALFMQTWKAALSIRKIQQRSQTLYILAPYMPTQHLEQVWEVLPTLVAERPYWTILERLAPRVPDELIGQFFPLVQTITNEEIRIQIMTTLIPRLPQELWPQIWESLYELKSEHSMMKLLIATFPYLSADYLTAAWDILQAIENSERWVLAIKEFLPYSKPEHITHIAERVLVFPYGKLQADMLEILAPYLKERQAIEIVRDLLVRQKGDSSWLEKGGIVTWNRRWRATLLAILIGYLPHEHALIAVPVILEIVQGLKAEEDRAAILTKLAIALPEDYLEETLDVLWSMESQYYQGSVLKELQRSTSASGRAKILEKALIHMQKKEDPYIAAQVLGEVKSEPMDGERERIYLLLNYTLHLLARRTRREALFILTALMPALSMVGNERVLLEVSSAMLEIGSWWP